MAKKKRIKRSVLKARARKRMDVEFEKLKPLLNQHSHYELYSNFIKKFKNPISRIKFTERFLNICSELHISCSPEVEKSLNGMKMKRRIAKKKRKEAKKKPQKANTTFSAAYGKEGNFYKLILNKPNS